MIVAPGATDVTTYFKLVDPVSGVPKTGLTITDLDATYVRDGAAAVKADLTALAAVDSAHGDSKAIQIDATNAPGLYRVDWPDAAFATGVARVQLVVNGAAIDPAVIEVELVPWLTPITGATVRGVNASDAALAVASTALTNATWTDARAGYIDKASYLPAVTAGQAGGVFIAGTNAATTVTTALTAAITGNITGNLSGSVGSVTGAVGSVGAGGITAASFGAGAIDAAAIATGAIDADAIADGAIDAGAIATGAIDADAIADNAIDAGAIATNAIDADALAANAITEIQAGLATPTNITAGTITTVSGNVNGSVGSVTGAVGSVTGLTAANLDTTVSSRAATGEAAAAAATLNDLSSVEAQAAAAAAITAAGLSTFAPGTDEVESGITWDEWAKALGAVLAGMLSGGGTTTVTFEAIGNDGTDRVQATVDADGNRSAVTLTL